MKILELTNYSAGICGVWQRVKQESELLQKKGHEVRIFSSNFVKGSNETAPSTEEMGKIKIIRFPAKKLGGESFMDWDFEKEGIKFKPDIIIAHSYRHKHTTKALNLAKKTKSNVFLVTHAPFIKNNSTRSLFSKIAVKFYDNFFGKKILNQFDGVFAITKWEVPSLQKIGLKKEKIFYSPNGVPDEFFKEKPGLFKGKNLLFLGRVAPIKDLETLIKSLKLISNEEFKLKIVGPNEKDYAKKVETLVKDLKLNKKVSFHSPVYNLKEKIKLFQESDIFILPSLSEAMPQSLIEAMASGNLVISSKNPGAKEIIQNEENGFLFEIGNEKDLAKKLSFSLDKKNFKKINEILSNSTKDAKKFMWSNLIKNFERTLLSKQ